MTALAAADYHALEAVSNALLASAAGYSPSFSGQFSSDAQAAFHAVHGRQLEDRKALPRSTSFEPVELQETRQDSAQPTASCSSRLADPHTSYVAIIRRLLQPNPWCARLAGPAGSTANTRVMQVSRELKKDATPTHPLTGSPACPATPELRCREDFGSAPGSRARNRR